MARLEVKVRVYKIHGELLRRPKYQGLTNFVDLAWSCRAWPPRVWRGAYRLQKRALEEFRDALSRDSWRNGL